MKLDRRQFLKSLAVGCGVATAGTLGRLDRLRADGGNASFTRDRFVFVEMAGAWDTLLSVDPRDPTVFTDAAISTTGIQLGYNLLPAPFNANGLTTVAGITFGPVVPQSFAALAPKMCVGRGFTMDTLSHDTGRLFWGTGRQPSGFTPNAPSISSQIVDQIAECDPDNLGLIPNLSINAAVHSFATDPKLRPFQIRNATDMKLALQLGTDPLSQLILSEIGDELSAYRNGTTLCDPAALDTHGKQMMSLVRKSQKEVEEIVNSGLADKFDILAPTPEMLALRQHYNYVGIDDASALVAVAAQAIKLDMSRCVTVQFSNSFDDHDGSWAADQPVDQFNAFDAIAKLYNDLAQTPTPEDPNTMLSEVTNIIIGSDFSRTPILNGAQGRDHWPTNSCVFIGRMPTGVIGASSYYGMETRPIDPTTGADVDPGTSGAIALNPGHWMASFMTNQELSIEHLREEPVPCLLMG